MRGKVEPTVILEDQSEKTQETDKVKVPLSQSEIEHSVYLAVCKKYDEYKLKRVRYRRYGVIAIVLSALVFILLMFSLESKVLLLIFWVITVVFTIVLMVRADYLFNMYSEMLGLNDGQDEDEKEEE